MARGRGLAAAPTIQGHRLAAQFLLQAHQDLAKLLAAGKAVAATEKDKIALARAARRRLDDGEKRAFMGVAEDREHRRALALVDGIVAPYAARDLTAVKGKKLVQFGTAEKDRALLAPVVAQARDRRHRPYLVIVGHSIGSAAIFPHFQPQVQRQTEADKGWYGCLRGFASARASGYGSARLARLRRIS